MKKFFGVLVMLGLFVVATASYGQDAQQPSISITSPALNQSFGAGTTSITLTVNFYNPIGHWHWQLNASFPTSGTAEGNIVGSGNTATITGLQNGQTYTVYVALVDGSHNLLSPSVGDSSTFSVASASEPGDIDVFLIPDDRPFFGEEITVGVNIDTLTGVTTVFARIDTIKWVNGEMGMPVDINGASPGDTLRLHLKPGTTNTYEGTTNGLDAIDRPMGFALDVFAVNAGDTLGHGHIHFHTVNLRLEATVNEEAGRFHEVFEPGDEVRFRAKVNQDLIPTAVAVDTVNIFPPLNASGQPIFPPRGQVSGLVAEAGGDSIWSKKVMLTHPADYVADSLLVMTNPTVAIPVEPGPVRFTTDAILLEVGVEQSAPSLPSSSPQTVLVPVFIGDLTDENEHDSVEGKGILATTLDFEFDHPALMFDGVVLLDGIAEQSDHRVVANDDFWEDGDHVELRVTTAGATPLEGEGPLYFLKFKVGTLGFFPPSDGFADVGIVHADLETEHVFLFAEWIGGGVGPLVGDVNRSGLVTAFDGILLLRSLVGIPIHDVNDNAIDPHSQSFRLAADTNDDDRISALDAALIFRFDAGIIDELPPPPAKLVPSLADRTVEVSDVQRVDNHLFVPVRLSDLSGIMAGEMTFAYDPSVFEVIGVTPAQALQGWQVVSNTEGGRLRVAFAGAQAGTGAGDLLRVELRPLGEPGITAHPLTITAAALNDEILKVTGLEGQANVPKTYTLFQNNPNPFNPETQISYELPKAGRVVLTVYNLTGQVVRTLVNAQQNAGRYTVTWDGRDEQGSAVATGVYVYRLTAGDFTATKKMVMMK